MLFGGPSGGGAGLVYPRPGVSDDKELKCQRIDAARKASWWAASADPKFEGKLLMAFPFGDPVPWLSEGSGVFTNGIRWP